MGTITSSGVYTAPAAVPSPNPVTVTATSQADPSKSASASVTITSPPPPIAMRGVSVSAGTTASGVDIGVRQVTPTLVLRAVGIGNTAGRVGVVVKRGDSPTLFLVGVGVVAGTVYQVSGGGVQVSIINFTQTTGGMPAVRLSVSISASAALGPRSIIATNSAGEISVFVGGLLITP